MQEVDAEAEDPTLEDGNSMRSSDSITSSILKYRTLYGRTYHSDRSTADYWYFTLVFSGNLPLG